MSKVARRSCLFVPGSRPERFEKAMAAGADQVCIDLEESVMPDQKDQARTTVMAYLDEGQSQPCEVMVRINAMSTEHADRDLQAIAALKYPPVLVMIAKVENAAQVQRADAILAGTEIGLIALIESPSGLLGAQAIADSCERLEGFMFGGGDYSAELGSDMSWEALYHSRAQLMIVAASRQLEMMDVPYLDIKDDAGQRDETRRIKAMGYTGKAVIHPEQIDGVNDEFAPSEQELAHAQMIIEEFEKAGGGLFLVKGKIIDRPMCIAAQRVVAMGEAAGMC